jgi:hypothetical protein
VNFCGSSNFINQEIKMYYLVNVYPVEWMSLMTFGMTAKRMRMLGMSMMKIMALTMKMETVTLLGKGG